MAETIKKNLNQPDETRTFPKGKIEVVKVGRDIDIAPGDVFVCPPGHDAWIVGNEPCVAYDFTGAETYAKKG